MTVPPPFTAAPGWAELDSALHGIRVFAPILAEEDRHSHRSYACPACGATTAWDAEAAALTCAHCGHTEAVAAQVVGRAADSHEFTLDALREDEKGWGTERLELHCDTCGSDLAVEAGAIAHTCAFCSSHSVGLREAAERRLCPQHVIPFTRTAASLAPACKAWLGKGWMHPGGLGEAASVGHLRGIYLPWWTFSADLACAWKAMVGHPHQVVSFDARGRLRTRTVIKWRSEQGQQALQLRDLLVPGTSRVSPRLLKRVADFDLAALQIYAPEVLAGFEAQGYDLGLVDAWTQGKDTMREKGQATCRAAIGSPHVRDLRITADFDEESWRYALLPVWVTAYRYQGKVYQVVVNGQTGRVEGQKPVAWWKIWLAISAMFLPGLGLGLVGLPLLLFAGAGGVVLFIALIAIIIAVAGAVALHKRAVEAEAP